MSPKDDTQYWQDGKKIYLLMIMPLYYSGESIVKIYVSVTFSEQSSWQDVTNKAICCFRKDSII